MMMGLIYWMTVGNVLMIVLVIGLDGIAFINWVINLLNVLKSVMMDFELETKCVTMDWMTTWVV